MPFDHDGDDDAFVFGAPLPPEDRLWRHPSELGAALGAAASTPPPAPRPTRRRPWTLSLATGLVGAALVVGALVMTTGSTAETDGGQDLLLAARGTTTTSAVTAPSTTAPARAVVPAPDTDLASTSSPTTRTHLAVDEDVARSLAALHAPGDRGLLGSALVFRADGYLVTTAAVLGAAVEVDVHLPDGRVLPGRVAGTDEVLDLGVVHVDVEDLDVVPLRARGSGVATGDPVTVVAGAGPDGTWSAEGVLAGTGRRVDRADGPALHGMWQITAPVTTRAAGAALCDGEGYVIGLVAPQALLAAAAAVDRPRSSTAGQAAAGAAPAGQAAADGPAAEPAAGSGGEPATAAAPTAAAGFAIPIDVVLEAATTLAERGTVSHAWLGLDGVDLSAERRAQLGLDGGAVITDLVPSGPGVIAGLRVGDVLTELDGHPVGSMDDLVLALRASRPGNVVTATYWRGGTATTVKLVLGSQ